MADKLPCPHCGKRCVDQNGLFLHVKAKHGRRLAAAHRPPEEQSLADLFIDAEISRAAGEPVDDWIADMLP